MLIIIIDQGISPKQEIQNTMKSYTINLIKYKDIFINSGRGQNSGAPFRYGKQRHHVPGHDPREDCGVEGCRTVLGLEEGDQDGGIAAVTGGSAGQGDAGL